MRTCRGCRLIGIILLAAAYKVGAQEIPPFLGGGVVAFDPTISVINSGISLPARSNVSDDRKYVTINAQPTLSGLRSLVTFPVSQILPAGQGFVGGVSLPTSSTPTGRGSNAAGGSAGSGGAGGGRGAAANSASPDQLDRNAKSWIFVREGTYLVKRLD